MLSPYLDSVKWKGYRIGLILITHKRLSKSKKVVSRISYMFVCDRFDVYYNYYLESSCYTTRYGCFGWGMDTICWVHRLGRYSVRMSFGLTREITGWSFDWLLKTLLVGIHWSRIIDVEDIKKGVEVESCLVFFGLCMGSS